MPAASRSARATRSPFARGCADDGVDRLALGVGRLGARAGGGPRYTASTRIAVALNSAVPDFGSVASIVSTFVATRVGEVQVHEREARAAASSS